MKKAITFILLFKGCVAFGQSRYSLVPKEIPKYDTIKVVMMVSDTTFDYVRGIKTIDDSLYMSDSIKIYNKSCFWQHGYEVREKHHQNDDSNGDWYCWDCPDYFRHLKYLNENKQPLSKNSIVWQSISY